MSDLQGRGIGVVRECSCLLVVWLRGSEPLEPKEGCFRRRQLQCLRSTAIIVRRASHCAIGHDHTVGGRGIQALAMSAAQLSGQGLEAHKSGLLDLSRWVEDWRWGTLMR